MGRDSEGKGGTRPDRTREQLLKEYGAAGIMRARKGGGASREKEQKEWEERREWRAKPARVARRGKVALGIVGAGATLAAVWAAVGWWEFFKQETAALRNLALIVGGIVALVAALWRRLIAQRHAEAAERGAVAAEYQHGVEMLGHERVAVRVGGIHVLRNLGIGRAGYSKEVAAVLYLFARGKEFSPMREDREAGLKVPADEWEAYTAAEEVEAAWSGEGTTCGK